MGGAAGKSQRPLALVTGGAKRVGRATALALAAAGCDVVITYRESEKDAWATVADLEQVGGTRGVCCAMALDLGDAAAVEAFARGFLATHGRLDVLVHNASTYVRTPLENLSHAELLEAFTINAATPALLSRHLAPLLARSSLRGGGAMVAMCDIHALGEHGLPRSGGFLAYAMSKAALAEMVRTLARELAPRVRVNGVAPGVAAWPDSGYEADRAAQQAYLQRVPLGRAGTVEECADVVRWLALEATYITGEIVRVDGGRNMV